MTTKAPRVMDAPAAALVLAKALGGPGTAKVADMTIADAAVKSGLPLWDAERALHALVSEYRGHLRVTAEGELLFRFPHGFTKPWQTSTWLSSAASTLGRGLMGALRFVVRAWVAIVLVAYVLIFVAILIGLAAARSDSRDRGGGGLSLAGGLLRVVFDALFWTFHPFSPFAYSYHSGPAFSRSDESVHWGAPEQPKTPFYEKVNRFFFGPAAPPEDPRAMERKIVAEIRAQKGRIGLADVMRVSGLTRDKADPLMARLMLEFGGSVEVSEEGGIAYRFADIRKTAADPRGEPATARPDAVWAEPAEVPPLTGNSVGSNALIMLLNGFNLLASYWALSSGFTIERVTKLIEGVPLHKIPPDGTAWALGVVPLVFSIALFALPLLRALWRPIKARRAARENGRRALVRAVLEATRRKRGGVSDAELAREWEKAAGSAPDPQTISREVVALGGDVDMENVEGGVRYRFPELEVEARAVEAEREAAAEEEARVGPVVFSSET